MNYTIIIDGLKALKVYSECDSVQITVDFFCSTDFILQIR